MAPLSCRTKLEPIALLKTNYEFCVVYVVIHDLDVSMQKLKKDNLLSTFMKMFSLANLTQIWKKDLELFAYYVALKMAIIIIRKFVWKI